MEKPVCACVILSINYILKSRFISNTSEPKNLLVKFFMAGYSKPAIGLSAFAANTLPKPYAAQKPIDFRQTS
ncbi:hypothetical protein [Ferruginibacter sp.]